MSLTGLRASGSLGIMKGQGWEGEEQGGMVTLLTPGKRQARAFPASPESEAFFFFPTALGKPSG